MSDNFTSEYFTSGPSQEVGEAASGVAYSSSRLLEQAERLSREVFHGVPAEALSTSIDLERGMAWVRPQAMDSSHRPITIGTNSEGQMFEVVDRREVPPGEVGPWVDPEPLSDEQRLAGARLVSEREAQWDVDSAVLRDGEQSVAATWASASLTSTAAWWEPREAAALERWARAQAALAGGDARVTVYEGRASGSDDAGGRLIDMRGNGMDCRVRTALTYSGENQVQVADAKGVRTLPVSEVMNQVRDAWPDTATQALDQRAETVAQTQTDEPELTVYTKPDCPGCTMTRRELDKAGAAYQEVDLTTRPDLVEQFRAEGLRSAPVVEFGDERIAGFNPAKIRAIAAQAMSPTPPTAPAPTGASQPPASRPSGSRIDQQLQVRGETR